MHTSAHPWQYKHTALRATAALVALATAMLFCFSKLLGVRQHGQHAPCPQRQRCPPAIEARSRLHTAALQAAGQSYGRLRARAQPRGLSETPPRSPVAQRLVVALQVLYLVAIFTTSLLCPMLLVHLQQYRAAACWKRPPGTGAPARYPGFLGRAHQASSCAMRLGRAAEPFARPEAVVRLEARVPRGRLSSVRPTGADIQGPWDVAVRAFLRAQSASQT